MMSVELNDAKTLEAIKILADVLDDMAGPERLECLMAANALRQVLSTQSETALNFARQAFESLDPAIRSEIRSEATEAAIRVIQAREKAAKPSTKRLVRQPAQKGPSTILDAINGGGMRTERKW